MTFEPLNKIAARLALVLLLVVGGFTLAELVRKADAAVAKRQSAAASAPTAAN